MSKAKMPAKSTQTLTGPTYLTIVRIILAIIFAVFAMLPCYWARITAIAIFIVAAITDKVDGIWARKQNLVTDLGAFLDPLADKMLTSLAFLILVYQNIVPLWVFAIILVRDFTVDGLRMAVARTGVTIPASFFGKLKTTVQILAIIILLFSTIIDGVPIRITGDVVLYISLFLTVASGADYLVRGYQKLTKEPKK